MQKHSIVCSCCCLLKFVLCVCFLFCFVLFLEGEEVEKVAIGLSMTVGGKPSMS